MHTNVILVPLRLEGGSEQGCRPRFRTDQAGSRFGVMDRTLQFTKTCAALRPVELKPWSVVLFHKIPPTIFGKHVFECLFSKRRCQQIIKSSIFTQEYRQIDLQFENVFFKAIAGGIYLHTVTPESVPICYLEKQKKLSLFGENVKNTCVDAQFIQNCFLFSIRCK